MSQETLKYIFWGMLCFPVLVLGIGIFNSLLTEILHAERDKSRRKTKAALSREAREKAEKQAALEAEALRRKKFDEEYKKARGI